MSSSLRRGVQMALGVEPDYRRQVGDMPADITLISFDPGGRTGFMFGTYSPDGHLDAESVGWGQLGPNPHHRELWRLLEDTLDEYPHLAVVAENYLPEFARPQNYVALEYLGVIEAFCKLHLVPFERQARGKKDYWTREKLQAVGLWPKGQVHAQDATRHWIAYAIEQNAKLKAKTLMMLK